MPGGSTGTPDQPSNKGAGYDSIAFTSADEGQRVTEIGNETQSIAIIAHPDNDGFIYVGFDEEVTSSDGFILPPSISVTLDVDANNQGVFAAADTVGDELRWIALR